MVRLSSHPFCLRSSSLFPLIKWVCIIQVYLDYSLTSFYIRNAEEWWTVTNIWTSHLAQQPWAPQVVMKLWPSSGIVWHSGWWARPGQGETQLQLQMINQSWGKSLFHQRPALGTTSLSRSEVTSCIFINSPHVNFYSKPIITAKIRWWDELSISRWLDVAIFRAGTARKIAFTSDHRESDSLSHCRYFKVIICFISHIYR